MKKCLVALIFMIIMSLNIVSANTINSIDMDIYIDNSGDAHVTEIWNCKANENTEWYHTYKNIGNSEFTNFIVKDENNVIFESLDNWDVNGSFYDKKYKSGINYLDDGVELCFGISEYSTAKTYTTTYTISNFVSNVDDAQMIYWTLIDFNEEIGNVYIKIHSDIVFADTLDVWGFGNYGGTAYVYDGYIEMLSPGNLESNEYMTILVKFPLDMFGNASNNLDNDFNYYLAMAEEGSNKYDEEDGLIGTIIFTIFIIWFIHALKASKNNDKIIQKRDMKEIKSYKEYFRDIPCNKDIFRAYYIAFEYNILENKTDLFGAILLKWVREKIITIKTDEVGLINKKDEISFIFNKDISCDNELETKLYTMMYEASKDGILEKNEFEKWAEKYYQLIYDWFDDVIDKERQKLVEEGILHQKGKKTAFTLPKQVYDIKDKDRLNEEAKKVKGLKNYLKDYTLINERKAIEVNLFEEYLMYAQIFGIAKAVIKEFKDLYPDLINESSLESYDNVNSVYYASNATMHLANQAYNRAQSYNSGGGGFSSGGGGGGSFGGGRWRLKIVNYIRKVDKK